MSYVNRKPCPRQPILPEAERYLELLQEELKDAGIQSDKVSPKLLPNYARGRKDV